MPTKTGWNSPRDGRFLPLSLTPELSRSICESVRAGLFDAQNALKHGIDVSTLKSWVDRGLDEEAIEPYRAFAEEYLLESIALEERVIGKVLEAADQWLAHKDSVEVWSMTGAGLDDVDSSDADPAPSNGKKTKNEKRTLRGDWRAAAWYAERRWPLRWGINRQPEGGPKEAIKLPDGAMNRRRKVLDMVNSPPPELVKAFREAGYDIVKREENKP